MSPEKDGTPGELSEVEGSNREGRALDVEVKAVAVVEEGRASSVPRGAGGGVGSGTDCSSTGTKRASICQR